ncbi:translation initiation factor IF-3 [Patescibacteria group bacterium]|nr:translation initiation factor IF-3 [Patescibacteria group bacterium]
MKRQRSKYKRYKRKFYKINQYITAPQVRLIDENSKQIGILSLYDAKQKSHQTGLDLVEIVGKAKPPVVKLIDFAKFKYQEAKKEKNNRKDSKSGELKEIHMKPFIGQSDYETLLKKAQKFLSTGNKVKLCVKFLGRQITKKEFGYKLAERFQKDLEDVSTPEGNTKLAGKRLFLTLTPTKKINKPSEKEKQKTKNQEISK